MSHAAQVARSAAVGAPAKAAGDGPGRHRGWADYAQLTKPRITLMVVLTTLVGFLEATVAPRDVWLALHTLAGTALVAAAASTFNQVMERRADGAMIRTMRRPLPDGRLSAAQGAGFGGLLLVAGTLWLWAATTWLAALLALLTALSYLLVYTPLKKVSSASTVVGAVPGAIPPMIGWAAARGSLGPEAWVLFGIVFCWQMPHFLAIATMYRDDYTRAGFRVLPVVAPDGVSTARHAVVWALALLPVSLLPAFIGMAGPWYFAFALALGLAFLGLSVRLMMAPGDLVRARRLFLLSLAYLPLISILLVAL